MFVHGDRNSKLYHVWGVMRYRCQGGPDFPLYGGRGITVCPEWETWLTFKAWALANGYREGLMLDRQHNDRGYSPDNCRWVTAKEQMRNRRSNRPVIRSDGRVYATMIEAAEDVGCSKANIYAACKGKTKTAKGFGWAYHLTSPVP